MEKCPYAYYDGNGRWLCVGQGKSFAVSRKGLPGKGCDENLLKSVPN